MATTPRDTNALHMVRMWLESRRLVQLGKALHLPLRDVDEGYLVHCLLGEVFGAQAPGPFAVEANDGRHLRVLAYSELNAAALEAAAGLADPSWHSAFDWGRFASKPMPAVFPIGMRLAFAADVCPIVRKSSADPSPERRWRKGAEVDAFLAACWAVGPDEKVARDVIYGRWLAHQLERRGGATLVDGQRPTLESFRIARMVRRNHRAPRKSHVLERPSATLSGVLEVTDPVAFRALLARGVGRHRAFGHGMLRLRRA